MTKRFIKDNRGQVLYAVIITIMFVGLLSMIAMGLTLKNYQAAQQKQQRVTDYYAADAVAELIRIGEITITGEYAEFFADDFSLVPENEDEKQEAAEDREIIIVEKGNDNSYTITTDTATIVTTIEGDKFISWEVSYHAEQPAE